MSAPQRLAAIARAARWRRIAIVASIALPLVAGVATLAPAASRPWLLGAALLATALIAWVAATLVTEAWVTRGLDDAAPQLEDSTALLLAEPGALNRLQRLQRARIEQRLDATTPPDLRPPWPWPTLGLAWAAGIAMLLAAAFAPPAGEAPRDAARASSAARAGWQGYARVVEQRLEIAPPGYTGLPARTETALSARVPQGSTLRWTLRIDPQPAAVALVFLDDSRLPLKREGASWSASRAIDAAALYRIALEGAPALEDDALHRLDVDADQPPAIRVTAPERALTLLAPEQKEWALEFEASDDFGLADARLDLTLALGGGENISVKEQSSAIQGEGSATLRRYVQRLDLAALGIAAGDDVIARVVVTDNREPEPQSSRSSSFILRWPPEKSAASSGMEGLVVRVLPAYFRSQRQIIIDSEALIAERPKLEAAAFLARSEAIGVDQRILRMRYGQFLGEENAGDDAAHGEPAPSGAEHADEEHAGEPPAAEEDEAAAMLAEYGHTHDDAEAATLLDPETRRLLKAALDQMWQAEMHLRLGAPSDALPFEYRALGYIKQVQQASRIYLARVGLELPAIDEARRLTGKREGLGDRAEALAAAPPPDPLLAELWEKLAPGAAPSLLETELQSLQRWVRGRGAQLPDALGLLAAIDTLRRKPGCVECAGELRARLWPLLPVPAAGTAARNAGGKAGQAYLDALRGEAPR